MWGPPLHAPRLPNIVYILADDLGYGDVHALNPKRGKIPTPNLDKFATQGMVFTDAHACSAVCTPSRYGILTGRYNWRTRLQMGILNAQRDSALIAPDRLTVPGFLRKHGYRTAGMGKWHLGWGVPIEGNQVQTGRPVSNGPTTRGFDEYSCVNVRYFTYMFTVNDRFVGTPLRKWTDTNNRPPLPPTDDDYADVLPWTTDATIEYLARRAGDTRPFFVYAAPMVPHSDSGGEGLGGPQRPGKVWRLRGRVGRRDRPHPGGDRSLWARRQYPGALHRRQRLFPGRPIKDLEAKGHFPNERSRGCKANLWDGGHREPFIVRWPGKVAPGARCNHPICLTDLLATCAEIVGDRLPDNAGEDSVSILPLLQGKPGPAADSMIHHSMLGKFAIRQGKWKLLLCAGLRLWVGANRLARGEAGAAEAAALRHGSGPRRAEQPPGEAPRDR